MSEPYSIFLRAKVSQSALGDFMASRILPASRFDDWPSDPYGDGSTGRAMIEPLHAGQTVWQVLDAGYRTGRFGMPGRFHHDPATDVLTLVQVEGSENWHENIPVLHALRSIASQVDDEGDSLNYLMLRSIFAGAYCPVLIAFRQSQSVQLDPRGTDPLVGRALADTDAVYDDLYNQAVQAEDGRHADTWLAEFATYEPG